VEVHGDEAQDEHFFPTLNGWTNREGELGDPIIPKELCGGGSTKLGGPFGVGRVLLQQFGAFGNGGHPISNGDGQVINCAHNLGWTTPSDASEEVPMVTQLDEERHRLWERAKPILRRRIKSTRILRTSPDER